MAVVYSELDDGVCTVTLDDEAKRNALSTALVEELTETLDAADADPGVRVVVLTNTGNTFCAGADLSEDAAASVPAAIRDPAVLFGRFARSPKPYVGRIAGHCLGGGVGLAAAMDVCVAVEDARFGFTEVRVGVSPAAISVVCLPKLRVADARSAMLRGSRFDAAEAARMGLINDAVPLDRLDAAVDAVVTDLLAGGPEALAATKQVLARVPDIETQAAYDWAQQLSARLFASDEAQEGRRAFREKRPPAWSTSASGVPDVRKSAT